MLCKVSLDKSLSRSLLRIGEILVDRIPLHKFDITLAPANGNYVCRNGNATALIPEWLHIIPGDVMVSYGVHDNIPQASLETWR